MTTLGIEIGFSVQSCANCGVTFAITAGMEDQLRKTGNDFYCPNGHTLVFGNSLHEHLKKANAAKARVMREVAGDLIEQADELEASARDQQRADAELRDDMRQMRRVAKQLGSEALQAFVER